MTSGNIPPKREWLLVVDDDEPIRRMVAECLVDAGVDIVGAANADQALQLIGSRSEEPVVALIDVLMPGTDGLTLARKLRDRFKRCTIVIMSGHMTDLSWWPVELRDVEFISKPFRLADLMNLVASARAGFKRE